MCFIWVRVSDGWFKLERSSATLSIVGCWVLFGQFVNVWIATIASDAWPEMATFETCCGRCSEWWMDMCSMFAFGSTADPINDFGVINVSNPEA
ncbi:transmembrane protein, putative [Medicago truncatula]|uniref:Transmembrane protein, putative n=1 Tax=Medicago truncatula TaxID=3880 RepID=G7KBU5_MEDTR|nr:transmembrane protein, putative [Medicago truncatula]